jgi:opacity protein-like surface antigen
VQGLVTSYSDSAGVGIDYSRLIVDHFEIGVSALDVFFASGSNLYALNLNPAVSFDVEQFHFYGGPSIGQLVRQENSYITTFNSTSFSVGAFAGVDFAVFDQWMICASFHYMKAANDNFVVFNYAGGIGLKF